MCTQENLSREFGHSLDVDDALYHHSVVGALQHLALTQIDILFWSEQGLSVSL
jgi:hypothetical protein